MNVSIILYSTKKAPVTALKVSSDAFFRICLLSFFCSYYVRIPRSFFHLCASTCGIRPFYTIILFYVQCFYSRINCTIASFFFNSKKLVVLSHTFTSAWCTCLNLASVKCYCKVSNCCVCCFT